MNEVGIVGSFLTAFGVICILIGADVPSLTYGTMFSKGSLLGFLIGGLVTTFIGAIAWLWGVMEEMWENEKESRQAAIKLIEDTSVLQNEEGDESMRF